jgi:O-antigen/teichoic acid export membrane protein
MTKISTLITRTKLIATGGVSRVIISLNSVIASFVVIRWQSTEMWGGVVPYLLFLDIGFSVIAWGATPFLIREFSFHPKDIKSIWARSFCSRSPLLILFFSIILFSSFTSDIKIILAVWAVARYIYHSFEPMIQFERKFNFSLLTELLGLAAFLIPIFSFSERIETSTIVLFLTGSMLLKAIMSIIFFRSFLKIEWPQKAYFLAAFPFLLLTFSAMLQQRADLYCVAYFLPKADTAKYQVFINLLIFSQFLASLLLSPFAKNIFRLSKHSLLKLERRFIIQGIPLSGISVLGVFILMRFLYHLELSFTMYVLGFFYVLAFYTYLLKNYELGKSKQQIKVSVFSFASSMVNIILSIWLTPLLHLEGALLAGLTGQLFMTALYNYKSIQVYAPR